MSQYVRKEGGKKAVSKSLQFFLSELSSVLEVFSSAVNFVVYCAFLRRFRRRLAAALCCCLEGVASVLHDFTALPGHVVRFWVT